MNQITTLLLLFALSIIVVVAVVPIVNEIAYYQAGVLATSSMTFKLSAITRAMGMLEQII